MLRSACSSGGSRVSALVLVLVRLGSARTTGRCSYCTALDDCAGGGRCTLVPLSLSLESLPLRLANNSGRASSRHHALTTAPPLTLVMVEVDDWRPQAV